MALRVYTDEFSSAMGLWMIAEAGGMHGPMALMDNGPGSAADGEKKEEEKKAPKKEKRQLTQEEIDRIAKSKAESAARKAAKGSQKQGKGKGKGGGGGGGKKKGAPADPNQPEITKLDIRVGKITKVWRHETADKLYCEEIDVGEDAPRQIASGLVPHYSLEQMQDKRLLVFCNLKARNLVGFKSHGMVLCAAKEVDGKEVVEFIDPPADAKVGERISVEGLSGDPVTPAQVDKKKVFVNAVPDLKTSADRVATWKGHAFMTSAGPCTAPTLADAAMR